MSVLDPDQLATLAVAVAEGTFEAAAHELHLTPLAVSQRIKALERSAGRVLLVGSKPVRATPSGEVLLRAARQIEVVTGEAVRELEGNGGPSAQVIPLAANADSLATWLLPALAEVDEGLVFDVRREDEALTAELLRRGEVMAAVTAFAEAVPGCSVERLGKMRYRPRAASRFAAQWFADGVTPATLGRAPVVVFDREDRLQDAYLRRRTRRRLRPPRHYVPGSDAFRVAVGLGLGWGMLPDLQLSGIEGTVDLDPGGAIDVVLYWQQWRLRSSASPPRCASQRAPCSCRDIAGALAATAPTAVGVGREEQAMLAGICRVPSRARGETDEDRRPEDLHDQGRRAATASRQDRDRRRNLGLGGDL
ncbi:MAG: ArgP/LysG family DNA-binding transcriptional regulator [Actinomycetota bacterium]|nr:ArgP/LysG family DNA-binding transcriptional regulator [Actinomycetota bacterium]